MIDPKLLTKDAGFEDGVVYEINWGLGVKEWFLWGSHEDPNGWDLESMLSIRPLTGPMAIWNFAPKWAKSVYVFDDGLSWKTTGKDDWIREWPELDGFMYDRPWWSK